MTHYMIQMCVRMLKKNKGKKRCVHSVVREMLTKHKRGFPPLFDNYNSVSKYMHVCFEFHVTFD